MLDLVEGISPLRCSSLLSQSDWLRCQQAARISDFVFSSYDLELQAILKKISAVIHAFLFEHQSTGRCLVANRCSLNARGSAALPMTRVFKFSPVALKQKIILNLSLDSFPPLHFSPF
jgi:hypothetical protein